MGTTASSQRVRKSRARQAKATKRTLGVVPFAVSHERSELREFEAVLVYGIQELIGLLGKAQITDLAPCYPEDELARRRDSIAVADTRDLLRSADAAGLLTGRIDADIHEKTDRVESLHVALELRTIEGRKVDVITIDALVRNIASTMEPDRFLVDVDELMAFGKRAFLTIKRKLAIRYLAGPDRRKYYDYRLRHPLTRSFEALRYFVRARRMATRREDKLALYKRAVRYDPCLGHAYRNIGYLYKEAKDLETAIHYYEQAVHFLIDSETLADAYAELGLCHANLNQVDEAIRKWHVSRRWNHENKDVYANLAIGYEEKGMIPKAIRYFSHAQRIDPEYYWACRGLGRIYAGQQDWKRAIEQLEIQLKVAPEDAWGHYTLGNCYFHEGENEKARTHCRRAVELDPHGDAGRRAFQLLMEIDE